MASIAFLVGCNHNPPVVPAIPESTKTVNFDASLLKDCPDLPKTKSNADVDLKNHTSAVVKLYVECATAKKKENQEIKKVLNIK